MWRMRLGTCLRSCRTFCARALCGAKADWAAEQSCAEYLKVKFYYRDHLQTLSGVYRTLQKACDRASCLSWWAAVCCSMTPRADIVGPPAWPPLKRRSIQAYAQRLEVCQRRRVLHVVRVDRGAHDHGCRFVVIAREPETAACRGAEGPPPRNIDAGAVIGIGEHGDHLQRPTVSGASAAIQTSETQTLFACCWTTPSTCRDRRGAASSLPSMVAAGAPKAAARRGKPMPGDAWVRRIASSCPFAHRRGGFGRRGWSPWP